MEQYKIPTEPHSLGGYCQLYRFPNNYGASVIKNSISYGHEDDLFELAVIKFNGDEWHLDYSTPITDDVIGYLTSDEVNDWLLDISELPKVK